MGVGKTELCMLAVIVASALYLYLGKDDEHNLPILLSEDDIPADPPDYNPAEEHGVRVCKSNGHAPNVFVLDLTYSVFPNEKIGDDILQDLFEYCSCTNWGGDCYEWTLVIEELDFVKTKQGSCRNTVKYSPVYKNATNPVGNSTVAKVYVREGGSFDVLPLDCVYDTVNAVLENALSGTENEYIEVVTVLANEIKKVTSICVTTNMKPQ